VHAHLRRRPHLRLDGPPLRAVRGQPLDAPPLGLRGLHRPALHADRSALRPRPWRARLGEGSAALPSPPPSPSRAPSAPRLPCVPRVPSATPVRNARSVAS